MAGDVADVALNYYLVLRKARQAEYVSRIYFCQCGLRRSPEY